VSPAFADEPGGSEEGTEAQVVQHVRFDPSEVRASASTRSTLRKAKASFLNRQARAGVLWDAADVDAATMDGVTVAWTDSVDVTAVEAAIVNQPDGDTSTELAAYSEPEETSDGRAFFRAGSDALSGVTGKIGPVSAGSLTVTNDGDKITTSWERYQVNENKTDRDQYYYGHWITATGKVISGHVDDFPGVIDIRSRPKQGRKSDFINMPNYWPKQSGSDCDDYAVGVTIAGFGATLPLGNCNGFTPDPDTSNYLMKNLWSDGACRNSRSEYLDLGMAVDIKPTVSTAVLSDYSYAMFENAVCDQTSSNNIRVIYADPGW
jgi:hypothetical protein